MDSEWTYYHETFDFDEYHADLLSHSAWVGHRSFAYDLVRWLKPRRVVELGTHYGSSFFTFCQGMKDGGWDGACVAVDTWKGDAHAGFYSEDVYQVVAQFAKRYPCAELWRDTFDAAAVHVEEESIDLLHIDGLHTYDAVRHDFETWLPKLAKGGVILFHDITVHVPDFGVYRLWEELTSEFAHHLAFRHSAGLGVLLPKGLSDSGQILIDNRAEIMKRYP
jgi:hypothetical protein